MKTQTKAGPREAPRQSRALLRADEYTAGPQREWLAEGVLLTGSPAVLAGERIGLTNFAVDLAVALATGTPFLGHFPVPRRQPVVLFCCDDEWANVHAQAELVANARGTTLPHNELILGTYTPELGTRAGLEEEIADLRDAKVKVVIIDPIVRALRTGGDLRTPELFERERLVAVGTAFRDAGMTPVFTHRTSWNGKEAGIEALTFAGLNDHVRQWLLVNRLPEPQYGQGAYRLTAGGLAGHGGVWSVRVADGQLRRDFSGRTWDVAVADGAEFPDQPLASATTTAGEVHEIVAALKVPKAKRQAGAGAARRA